MSLAVWILGCAAFFMLGGVLGYAIGSHETDEHMSNVKGFRNSRVDSLVPRGEITKYFKPKEGEYWWKVNKFIGIHKNQLFKELSPRHQGYVIEWHKALEIERRA